MTETAIKILLVDDEERLLDSMAKRLTLLGFEPLKASSFSKAIAIAKQTHIDLAIVDLKMPDMDGLVTITKLKEIDPDLRTVLLTGYGNEKVKQATEALGAMYFEKDSMGGLWDMVKEYHPRENMIFFRQSGPQGHSRAGADPAIGAQRRRKHEALVDQHEPAVRPPSSAVSSDIGRRRIMDLPKIIGETPGMQRLRKNIERLSELDCTIVIKGEAGTGKELAARTIHKLSHRKNQRFLAFDCGCFSNDFRFNELVASIEDSQTIETDKRLTFSGTILLDHIENMPRETQHQMMKIIEDKVMNRSTDSIEGMMDIRFIVATNQDLGSRVETGKFEKALYARMNAMELSVPCLKERRDDILPLSSYFLHQFNQEFNKNINSVSREVFSIFKSYTFPGNVRELKHIIERAVIVCQGTVIEPGHLPERLVKEAPMISDVNEDKFLSLHELEQRQIIKAIQFTHGNKSKAAELLGISRAALWRKLKLIHPES